MEQIGPTTGEFAGYRKVQKQTCEEIITALADEAGISSAEAQAKVIMSGLQVLAYLRATVERREGEGKTADLVIEAILAGFGWSGTAAFYDLDVDYINILDELNGMKVKDDNDLPPTKEKG